MHLDDLLVQALDAVVNQALQLDPDALARLEPLSGQVLGIELSGLGVRLYCLPEPGRLRILSRFEAEPDAWIVAGPLTLARMQGDQAQAQRLFEGSVRIRGDQHLAQAFGRWLGGIEIDWEEGLSRLTGDVMARRLGQGLRDLTAWFQESRAASGRNLREYLQEEGRLLPARPELEAFYQAVDVTRDDVERLEARLIRLQQRLGEQRGP